jgi:SAM-dependent methyltransferase
LLSVKARLSETDTFGRIRRLLRWSISGPSTIVLSGQGRFANAPVETIFHGKSGASVPVLAGFRYAMTPPLLGFYLPALQLLGRLDAEQRLTKSEREVYRRALGTRALSSSYGDVLALVADLLPRVSDRLVPEGRGDPERAQLMPSTAALRSQLATETANLRSRIRRIRQFVAPIEDGSRVLEIGFINGGYSIAAWDRLGFRVTGIDSTYDGLATPPTLHTHVADRLGARPTFMFGDITRRTELAEGSFDIVYSVSVLEHLSDVSAAFAECYRLLKPGGLMIHTWNPYFSPNGGHNWGLLDAPWAHLRIPQGDLEQYLDEMRPMEAPMARPWLWGTLDRHTTLAHMQTKVVAAGFRPLLWDQIPAPPDVLGDLTPEVFAACQVNYPDATLADLTSQDAMMVASKA